MNIPQHIVIVPDGNRRWAKERGKPSFLGHREGAKRMESVAKTAIELGVPALTIWGCSVANVTERAPQEVKFLFKMFEAYFNKLAKSRDIHKNQVRIGVIGRWEEFFPENLKKAIRHALKATEKYEKHQLTLLMAYSGTDEMTDAIRKAVEQGRKDPAFEVGPEVIKRNLWSRELPAVDLVIRTGGEPHWSAGMLMWDVAEARLHFTKIFWPDFGPEEFKKAMAAYAKVERRFGK
jgi:undecaprenyl diphosphate synthase